MPNNPIAIVTGSTSGIGLEIAEYFATHGYDLVINGLGNPADIEKLRQQLESTHKIKAIYDAANMMKPEEIRAMVNNAFKTYGRLDVLINNAGIQHVEKIEAFPDDQWNAIIAINLSASFHAMKAAVPLMRQMKFGRIINIASTHALVASPFKSAYVAAKHGVAGLVKTVALEVAQDNITVNAICPGYVKTPLVEKQIPETAKARGITEEQVINDVLLAAQPTHKFVTVEQIAAFALFLSSEQAASITGAILTMDGGWTAQ